MWFLFGAVAAWVVFVLWSQQSLRRLAITDRARGFRLHPPGGVWQLRRGVDAHWLDLDAAAGVTYRDWVGVVLVRRARDISLEGYARQVLLSEAHTIESIEHRRFCGRPAVELVASIELHERYQIRTILFARGDTLYLLEATGPEKGHPGEQAVRDFFRAFSLLRPPAEPPPPVPLPALASGHGWEISAGRFESALSGLAVEPPAGWHLLAGPLLHDFDDLSEVGLRSADGLSVFLVRPRWDLADAEAHLRWVLGAMDAEPDPAPLALTFAGQPASMHRIARPALSQTNLYGVVMLHDGLVVELFLQQAPGFALPAVADVAAAPSAVTRLPPTRRATLEARATDTQVAVTHNTVLLDGVYSDLRIGLRWRKPGPLWRVSIGAEASTRARHAHVVFSSPRGHVSGQMFTFLPEATHDELLSLHNVDLSATQSRPVHVGGASGTLSIERCADDPQHFAAVTFPLPNQRKCHLQLWGAPDTLTDAQIADVLDRFELTEPQAPFLLGDDRIVDARLGYAVSRPGVGWSSEVWPTWEGSVLRWTSTQGELTVEAVLGEISERYAHAVAEKHRHVGQSTAHTSALEGWEVRVASWRARRSATLLCALQRGPVGFFLTIKVPAEQRALSLLECFSPQMS